MILKMKNLTLFWLTIFFVTSCSTIPTQLISSDQKIVKVPGLGIATNQELGDTLMEYTVVSSSPSWEITSEWITKKNIVGVYHVIQPQVVKPLTVDMNGIRSYSVTKISGFGGLTPNGPMNITVKATYTDKGLCFLLMRNECLADYILPANYIDLSQPNVKQQLIYNGRLGDYVKFLYREVSEGAYLRQPFTQEIQYDLNEGKIIGFKGARIEILSATNRQIDYKVLQHFSPVL